MKRAWQLALVVLLVGALALALVLVLVLPKKGRISTAHLRSDGGIAMPDGSAPLRTRLMPDGRLAVTTVDYPPDAQYNVFIFDSATYTFTGYPFSPPGYPRIVDSYDVAADSTSTMLACSYSASATDSPNLCIGNTTTGELEFEYQTDYPYPTIQLTSGRCGETEVAVGVDPDMAKLFFLSFTDLALVGTVVLPENYRITTDWLELTSDYNNSLSRKPYFNFSSSTSTLFLPLPHLGLIYWCQIDLSSGFSYQDGTISCGVDPTFIAAPPGGTPLYILDDQANKVFVLDPSTRSITKSIDYEAGNIALRLIEHQGYIYITTRDRSTNPRVGGLIKIDPVTEQQWSVEFNGWSPSDLDAYQGRIYMIKKTGPPSNTTPTLVEYDAATLTQLSETFVCANGWQMDVIPQTGKGVIRDAEAHALFVVDLLSLSGDR